MIVLRQPKYERNMEIVRLVKDGWTCVKVGEKFGISRSRVLQIFKRYNGRRVKPSPPPLIIAPPHHDSHVIARYNGVWRCRKCKTNHDNPLILEKCGIYCNECEAVHDNKCKIHCDTCKGYGRVFDYDVRKEIKCPSCGGREEDE